MAPACFDGVGFHTLFIAAFTRRSLELSVVNGTHTLANVQLPGETLFSITPVPEAAATPPLSHMYAAK